MKLSYPHVFERATDPAAPPLVLLHGTGGDENDLVPLGRRISPGSALLSPRGKVSEHGANRFFARLAEGKFDPAEVTRRTHDLADFIVAASVEYDLDPQRLIAVGLSNGANIAAAILQLRPGVLGGAVLLRPMVVLDQPAAAGSLAGLRVLIASGAVDPIVPVTEPPRLAALLRSGGAEVELHTSPASHALASSDLSAAVKFFSSLRAR
ncbi:MAG: phospholipase/carboxylesterase [Verrucomicrobia bacterium]|nr:phospholipase/carboxylesterase [Verrucomicrobiota bacterium]